MMNTSSQIGSFVDNEPYEEKIRAFDALGKGGVEEGRIIKDENEEVIRVTGRTYLQLLEYCGGWFYLVLLNIVMLLFVLFKI